MLHLQHYALEVRYVCALCCESDPSSRGVAAAFWVIIGNVWNDHANIVSLHLFQQSICWPLSINSKPRCLNLGYSHTPARWDISKHSRLLICSTDHTSMHCRLLAPFLILLTFMRPANLRSLGCYSIRLWPNITAVLLTVYMNSYYIAPWNLSTVLGNYRADSAWKTFVSFVCSG